MAHKDALIDWADARPLMAPGVWMAAYLVLGLFGLPGSTVMNLSAGLLFGFREGLLLVAAGSTLASAVAFLSRFATCYGISSKRGCGAGFPTCWKDWNARVPTSC